MSLGKEIAHSGEVKEPSPTPAAEGRLWGGTDGKKSCRRLRSSDSLKQVLIPICSHFLHSCRGSLQKANNQSTQRVRRTRGVFGSEVNYLSFLLWPIMSGGLSV